MFLVIDNYDSFTYNLVQLVGSTLLGSDCPLEVYRNDALTVQEVLERKPKAILLSPGPCTPSEAGISLPLITAALEHSIPLFGVCLGHQAIGQALGGKVIRAPVPVHGKVDTISHNGGEAMFEGVPEAFQATRYHSLIIDNASLPSSLLVTARTKDSLIMAVRHREKPVYGVQFHPESIASEYGSEIISAFLRNHGLLAA